MKKLFVPNYDAMTTDCIFTTERVLRCLGLNGKLTGFSYMVFMVDQLVEDRATVRLITKALYPETAKYFGVTSGSVERAIRTLIHAFWNNESHEFLCYIAGKQLDTCPTNSEFLDIVTGYLRAMRKQIE